MATINTDPDWSLNLPDKVNKPEGLTYISKDGNIMLGDYDLIGVTNKGIILIIPELPTDDPRIKGAIWNNGSLLAVSDGPL